MVQRSSTTAFAKSTKPEIGGVVRREALYAALDGTGTRTLAWISAPPGFGKTTLAASYLDARSYRWVWYQVDPDDDDGETFFHYVAHAVQKLRGDGSGLPAFAPEHRADLAAFSRRFFRALFALPDGPTALILDNLHALADESPLKAILEAGLPQTPKDCCVIVTSRAPPPVSLSRLQPGGQMVCIDAGDLKFNAADLAAMASLRGRPLSAEALAQVNRQAEGWAAALVLMIEHHKLADAHVALPDEATPKAVFDYLAGEIFERFDPTTRRLLLQIACLPRVTIDIARALSGEQTAAAVLFNLASNDYFVRELVGSEGRVFVFHPLFRAFLLRCAARDLPQALGLDALQRAALLLRDAGQAEDALALYAEHRQWRDVAAIVREQAASLLAQGRHATLAGWLELLPPATVEGDAALLAFHGAALAHASPRAARRRFEQAFDAFERQGDGAGAARACLGVIETVLREFDDLGALDRWLDAHDRIVGIVGDASLPDLALVARLWRTPGHPAIGRWLAGRSGSAQGEVPRAIAALLSGDFARSAAIAGDLHGSADAVAPGQAVANAVRAWLDGDFLAAHDAARLGLEASRAQALPGHDVWLHLLASAAALGLGDVAQARAELGLVEALPLRRGDRAFLHGLLSALAQATGQPGAALREARSAVLVAVEAGLPWFEGLAHAVTAQLLSASGERRGAEAQLRNADVLAQRLGSPLLRLVTLFADAAVAQAAGDEGEALPPLRTGLALARELGARHVPAMPPGTLAELCALALRRDVAVEQVRTLIGAVALVPPPAALRLRRWPWAFEVATLGPFALRRGGETLEFSAKGPGRPVELLKVLISLGGQNVRADQLADALWPHVDADYAHKSFTATLHRLRRIFGEDETLRLRDGRLSLNDALFWLDARALDHVLAEIDACFRGDAAKASGAAATALMEEALTLYRGPFLLDDVDQPAYAVRREQLRTRLLRALARTARDWEEGGRADAAVDAYTRVIDVDEQGEAFYRNLMLLYQRQGDPAEALAVYERLQTVLAARLKGLPSAETQAVVARLRA